VKVCGLVEIDLASPRRPRTGQRPKENNRYTDFVHEGTKALKQMANIVARNGDAVSYGADYDMVMGMMQEALKTLEDKHRLAIPEGIEGGGRVQYGPDRRNGARGKTASEKATVRARKKRKQCVGKVEAAGNTSGTKRPKGKRKTKSSTTDDAQQKQKKRKKTRKQTSRQLEFRALFPSKDPRYYTEGILQPDMSSRPSST
jgi:hypothetical protein